MAPTGFCRLSRAKHKHPGGIPPGCWGRRMRLDRAGHTDRTGRCLTQACLDAATTLASSRAEGISGSAWQRFWGGRLRRRAASGALWAGRIPGIGTEVYATGATSIAATHLLCVGAGGGGYRARSVSRQGNSRCTPEDGLQKTLASKSWHPRVLLRRRSLRKTDVLRVLTILADTQATT